MRLVDNLRDEIENIRTNQSNVKDELKQIVVFIDKIN